MKICQILGVYPVFDLDLKLKLKAEQVPNAAQRGYKGYDIAQYRR